jgi:hypothetical protein
MNAGRDVHGYLPNETSPAGQLSLHGFQYVLMMFQATMLVAALPGFHVGTVLLASGGSTNVAPALSRRGIGSYGDPSNALGEGTSDDAADCSDATAIAGAPRSIDAAGVVQAARAGEAEATTAASRASRTETCGHDVPELGVDSGS